MIFLCYKAQKYIVFLCLKPWEGSNVKRHGIVEYPRIEPRRLTNPFQPVLQSIFMDTENPRRLLYG